MVAYLTKNIVHFWDKGFLMLTKNKDVRLYSIKTNISTFGTSC